MLKDINRLNDGVLDLDRHQAGLCCELANVFQLVIVEQHEFGKLPIDRADVIEACDGLLCAVMRASHILLAEEQSRAVEEPAEDGGVLRAGHLWGGPVRAWPCGAVGASVSLVLPYKDVPDPGSIPGGVSPRQMLAACVALLRPWHGPQPFDPGNTTVQRSYRATHYFPDARLKNQLDGFADRGTSILHLYEYTDA